VSINKKGNYFQSDESPKQLIEEIRKPIPAMPGKTEKYDYE
jgi:hypothetical protein